MKRNLLPIILLSLCFSFTFHHRSVGQALQVTSGVTPEEMVEILIGSGLDYSNVVFTGADSSRGKFWGGPGNIGLINGIILTSGNVDLAPGPNSEQGAGAANMTAGDPDLESLSPGSISYDACVLEFDFVPYFDYVWFQFVFASEEYPEYVGFPFNDVFGFFISGPGITGPYSNNSKNIAVLPGTEIPVSINNVNQDLNSGYYVANDSDFIQYDGFTTVLTAESPVVPMETYHIKLAIADITDAVFDSGVLLQASSFCSGPYTRIGNPGQPVDADNYRIYPVPAGNTLHVEAKDNHLFEIQIIGQDGKTWIKDSGNSRFTVDLGALPPGVYALRIITEEGITTRKFFKN